MKLLKRLAITAAATGMLVGVAIGPAQAVASGWYSTAGSYILTVDGCDLTMTVYPFNPDHYASASDGSCAGNVGVQSRYQLYSGSPIYTASIKYGASYVRQDVEILRAARAHH